MDTDPGFKINIKETTSPEKTPLTDPDLNRHLQESCLRMGLDSPGQYRGSRPLGEPDAITAHAPFCVSESIFHTLLAGGCNMDTLRQQVMKMAPDYPFETLMVRFLHEKIARENPKSFLTGRSFVRGLIDDPNPDPFLRLAQFIKRQGWIGQEIEMHSAAVDPIKIVELLSRGWKGIVVNAQQKHATALVGIDINRLRDIDRKPQFQVTVLQVDPLIPYGITTTTTMGDLVIATESRGSNDRRTYMGKPLDSLLQEWRIAINPANQHMEQGLIAYLYQPIQ